MTTPQLRPRVHGNGAVTAAWQGHGADPWLPERLAAQAQISAAERTVYWDYWGRLSGWLTRVHRDVMRGARPDASAVWAHAPAWAQAMTDFTHTTVPQVMRNAYVGLFGEGFRFDSRPAVAAHLAGVSNRMVRTPDYVFDLIAGEIAEGAGAGESVEELAARVDTALSLTGTERWRNRATTVARTETLGALNAGRSDAFTEVETVLGESLEQMWLATDDERTRNSHNRAEGQRVPLGSAFTVGGFHLARPGDPTGPAHEVINCRCTTLLLKPGETVDLGNRQYTGDMDPVAPPAPPPPAPPPEAPAPPPVPVFNPDDVMTVAGGLRPTAPAEVRKALTHQNTHVPATMSLLRGVRLDNAGTWNDALEDLRANGVTNVAAIRTAHAYYWSGDHKIHLAGKSTGSNYTATNRHFQETGWFARCDHNISGLESVTAHEFGHHVEAVLDADRHKKLWQFIARTLGDAMRGREVWAWMDDNRDNVKTKVSAYGSTSPAELLAEVWREYTVNSTARPHIRKIGDKMKALAEEAAKSRIAVNGGWAGDR